MFCFWIGVGKRRECICVDIPNRPARAGKSMEDGSENGELTGRSSIIKPKTPESSTVSVAANSVWI